MKKINRAILVGIVLLASLMLVSATLAQGPETLSAQTIYNVNIRTTPGLSGAVLGVVPPGQDFTLTGRTSGNNWVQVQYQTTTGWMASWLVIASDDTALLPVTTDLQPDPGIGPTEMLAPRNLNVRSAPSVNSTLIRTLLFNTRMPVVARNADSSWVRIQDASTDGWVAAWLVILDGDINALPVGSGTAPVPPASTPSDDEEEDAVSVSPTPEIEVLPPLPAGAHAIRAPFRVNVRSAPSVDSSVLDVLPFGSTVAAVGRNAGNNWIQVEYSNTLGWVASWVVTSSTATSTLPITDASATVAVSGEAISASGPFDVIMRTGPGLAFGQVTSLPAATFALATARSADGDWIQLSYGGVEGWAAAWVLLGTADFNNLPVAGQ